MGFDVKLLDLPVEALVEHFATADPPVPGSGSAAALVAATAAALVAMTARRSTDDWNDAKSVAAQAEALRLRALPLAQADAEAYARVLELLQSPSGTTAEARDADLADALSHAALLPLRIADVAADTAELAALVVMHGAPAARGDAAGAAILAEGAARVGARLVAINLASRADDARVALARQAAESATRSAARADAALDD